MCAIFGLLDYKGKLTAAQRLQIIKVLGTAAEVRGTDATGIAFFQRKKLCIQKAPKPAHKMRYRIPSDVRVIMGHTRMTTQGSAKHNQNNHPFPGKAGNTAFALAHNGVLTNDQELRLLHNLPETGIETDSHVAVQLIEKQKEVSPDSLAKMAELLEGHFTFTVLDQSNSLYFIKGNNPLTVYQFPTLGLYLYASTAEILDHALIVLGMNQDYQVIQPEQGEIVQIDRFGRRSITKFNTGKIDWDWPYTRWDFPVWPTSAVRDDYIDALKRIANLYGYDDDFVDELLAEGFSTDEIEDFIYCCKGVWE